MRHSAASRRPSTDPNPNPHPHPHPNPDPNPDADPHQERIPWTKSHFAQVVLTCASIDWAKQVEQRLTDESKSSEERVDSIASFNLQQIDELNASANQVAGKLSRLERATFVALMTGDVHNRDIVATMVKEKVDSLGSFTWQVRLRVRVTGWG